MKDICDDKKKLHEREVATNTRPVLQTSDGHLKCNEEVTRTVVRVKRERKPWTSYP